LPTKKSGIFWNLFETVGVRILSVSTYFILARLLKPDAFGLVALTGTFVFITEVLIDQGFVVAIIQKSDLQQHHLSSAYIGNIAIGLLFFGLFFSSAPLLARLYSEPELKNLLRVHSVSFVISAFSRVHVAMLQREQKFRPVAIIRTIGSCVSCFVSIIMAFKGYGAWAIVIQYITFNTVQSILFHYTTKWRPTARFSWASYKDIFSVGSSVVGGNLVHNLIRNGDSLVIGYFLGTHALGYYSFAQKIFVILSDLIDLTFSKVSFSIYASMQHNREKVASELEKFASYTAYAAVPVFTAAILFIGPIIGIFFDGKWAASVPVVQLLSCAGIFLSLNNNLFMCLQALGHFNLVLKFKLLHFFIGITMMLIAVQFSINAVALANLLAALVMLPVLFGQLAKHTGTSARTHLKGIITPIGACILIGGLIFLWSRYLADVNIFDLIWQGALLGGLYIGFVLMVNPGLLRFRRKEQTVKI